LKPDFLIIPYQLIVDKNLTPLDITVYAVIYWIERLKEGRCASSNEYIGDIANTTPGSVANAISKLAKLGYIEVVYSDNSRRYRLSISCKITFSNTLPAPKRTYVSPNNETYSKTELAILKFLDRKDNIKSPEAYLKWIKSKYGDKHLKKLLTTDFDQWITVLEHYHRKDNPPRVGDLI
jgi:hypothetical protein